MTFRSIGLKLLKLNHSNIFSVVISWLFMTSLSVGPHSYGVVSSAQLPKSEL